MKTSKKIIMYLCVLIVLTQLVLAVPPIPCAFGGTAKLNDINIIAGDVVQARDPQGTVCGTFIHPGGAMPAGYYGPLNCKGDDPETPQDEGAVAGDKISFFINGLPANLSNTSTTNDIWVTGGTKYGTNLLAYTVGCTSDIQCTDGLACNGIETCNLGTHICMPGSVVDCSAYNIAGIATCTNIPEDTNPYTWDYRAAFTSACEEPAGTCTSGSSTITHTCNYTTCSAQCDATHTCASTECDNLDGCQGADYYDYSDTANTCQGGCTCTNNVCSSPTIYPDDIRCQASTVTRGFSTATPPQCGDLNVILTVDINEAAASAETATTLAATASAEATPPVITQSVITGKGKVEKPKKGGIYGVTMPINVAIEDQNGIAASTVKYRVFGENYDSGWNSLTLNQGDAYQGTYGGVFEAKKEGLKQDKKYSVQIIGCNALYTAEELESVENGNPSAHCSELTSSTNALVTTTTAAPSVSLTAGDISIESVSTSYIIDEQPPAGWVITNAGGGDTSQPGHIKWTVISGATDIVYTYIVTVPCSALGVYNFTGIYKFDTDAQNMPILGATSVNVQAYGCQNDNDCNNLDNNYCSGDLIMHVEGVCMPTHLCQLGTPTQTQDCNSLNNNYCNGTSIKHDDYTCSNAACVVDLTTTVQDCRDSLACNGLETCSNAACVAGTPVNCNANNISGIATCTNIPDSNPYTWDYRAAFTSVCQEPTGCTSGSTTITYTCNFTQCSAQCDATHTCAPTECDSLDGCQGADYYDYSDTANTCQSGCTCTNNACTNPTITHNDSRCMVACSANSDCGTNGYVGNVYCSGGTDYFINRTQAYRTYTCNNPGTPNSSCSYVDAPAVIEQCCYSCYSGQCTNYIIADLNHDNQTDREVWDMNVDCKPDKWLYDYNFNQVYENINIDTDFDTLQDLWLIDADEDGTIDRWVYDTNADGKPDKWEYDYNYNSIKESVEMDTNFDAERDQWFADINEDGNMDRWSYDTNFDGKIDRWEYDYNFNGVKEYIEIDTNFDTLQDLWLIDANEDNTTDRWMYDTNLDAKPDKWEYDYNYNSIKESVEMDTNFDTERDQWFADINEDGNMDRWSYDTNFNGKLEVCEYDYDFDGIIDSTTDCSG